MKIFLSDKEIGKVIKYKKEIEKVLNISIKIGKDAVSTEGNAIDEYTADHIIRAIATGFDPKTTFLLEDPECMFEEISIGDYIKKGSKRIQQVRARIIGTKGKALKTLMQLTDCAIILRENKVAILGRTENVKLAAQSVISIIYGSKHGNVYARLEKLMSREQDEDLGLKEWKKKEAK